jgi:hypothetical protein
MSLKDISEFAVAGKSVIDLFRSAYALLPKGSDREKIESTVKEAEDGLRRSDAELAKALGYPLCQCTFPPQIMLWREAEGAWVCQHNECGHKRGERPQVITGSSWLAARR